ncbi:hypothetical protein LOTGIDRAFT_125127 [Lottia gigantea]|uniref:asparagine--tRNA ligase n=1 Tax=Lottia gigantea TaxID=225164 RepID=V4A8A6_LOTGI|nr:hypothetical protein LOTGIDRAFT_125127 [Lottia gigantea]ESO89516.1 hypothetical protein LOTGIDRAFT_125127 [Lottia gigantea]
MCYILQGWVKSIRKSTDVVFLHVCDGTSLEPLQIVIDKTTSCSHLTYGCCVKVKGQIVESIGQNQKLELVAETIDVIGECDVKIFPFQQRTHHTLDYDRNHLHLRPKTKTHSSLLRVRNTASMAVHQYYQDKGYCFVHTPILTTNDCEGAGEVFQIQPMKKSEKEEFFRCPTFLTVSGQLHLEIITGGLNKAYNFGPTFRAENSKGRHHLAEFYMIEAELCFLDGLDQLMEVMEDMIKTITSSILTTSHSDVEYFYEYIAPNQHKTLIDKVLNSKFERMRYTEAVDLLQKNRQKFKVDIKWGDDLSKEHEKFITKKLDCPVFITDYPATLKPFYARANEDGKTVAAVDLLVPEVGELIGGSLREERLKFMDEKLKSLKLSEEYQWYLDLRRYGTNPHGGYGLGFERYLQFLLGVSNIRDVIPFPRSSSHCQL